MNNTKLSTLSNPKSVVSEAFRTLRTNIQFTNIDKSIKAIVITSSGPREGKTTVVSNLAISIAQTEKSVLLIDCDMRKPSIHKVFGLDNQVGLTNILMGEKRLSDIKYKRDESTKSLAIVTSGPIPPNPAELLGSKMMKNFLEDMRKQFDIIIIDSPPINLVTDSAVLSTIADATIMVVEVGETDKKAAIYGKELLDKVNANLIGIVLNKIPSNGKSYYNYSYYQYEEYYEDGEGEEKKESSMIDIHSHILPYMDDGPKDMDMSLSIAEIYVKNGMDKVIATPHYTDAVMNKSNEDLRIGLEALKKELANAGIPLEVYPGNEVYIKPDILADIESGKIKTLNDSRYVLIELPMNEIPIYVEDAIYKLCIKGFVPIIAHPERNSKISKDPNILYRYITMGALTQLNLSSIKKPHDSRVKTTAELLLKHKMIHFVGTDTHSNGRRSANVRDALDILLDLVGKDYFELLTIRNPEAVLNNEVIDIIPPKKISGRGGSKKLPQKS